MTLTKEEIINIVANFTEPLEERIKELEGQVEALRRPLSNYVEKKETLKLWGRKRA